MLNVGQTPSKLEHGLWNDDPSSYDLAHGLGYKMKP